jgi:predicted transcriptional regulator
MEEKILFKEKQTSILLSLRNNQQPWRISSLSKACGTTYVHTSNFIKKCEKMGITSNEKHGKIKEIKLTDKGMQIANMLSSIYTIMSTQGQPQNGKPEEPQKEAPAEKK